MRLLRLSSGPCLIALSLSVAVRVAAQPLPEHLLESWRWTRFTTASGLPSNRVSNLNEASDGTVWALAAGTALRFDGFRWQTIPNPSHDGGVAQVTGDAGEDLGMVAAGQFWIGVPGRMRAVLGPNPRVLSAARVGSHRYIVHRADHSLAQVDAGQVTVVAALDGVGRQRILDLWSVPANGAMVQADAGLYVHTGRTWRHLLATDGARMQVKAVDITAAGDGLAYIHYPMRLRGVWSWTASGPPTRVELLPTSEVTSLSSGPAGTAVVAYLSGDVWFRRAGSWRPLSDESHADIFADTIFVRFASNGNLWVGRERGLFLHRQRSDRWHYYESTRGPLWNQVNDLLLARSGTLWVATASGVLEHRPDGTRVEHELDAPVTAVTGLAEDAAGRVWSSSGASFTGVRRFDGGHWTTVRTGTALDDVYVHRIAKDRQGRLWFLTLNKSNEWQPTVEPASAGAFRFDGERFDQWGPAQGLHGRVYALAESDDGALWFGTSKGLQRWKDGVWRSWDTTDQFLNNRVFTLTIDPSQRVWFGDQQRGLGYLDGDVAHHLTTADGLVSEAVWGLATGASGEVWVATHGGLSRHGDDTWATFDAETGLRSTQLWPIVVTPDDVYVGTAASGVARLSLTEAQSPAPLIDVAAPVVTGTSALVRWAAHAWWGEQPPDQVRTRVRVDGAEWSTWSTVRERTMTGLAPGTHAFEVQSANQFGRHDQATASVAILIPRPLHLQPQFFMPLAALCAVVAGLAVTLRVKQRRHRAEQAAAAETLQQAQKMESIGRLAGGVAHDFNNLLTVILGNVDLLKTALSPGGGGSRELASIRVAAEQAGRLTRQLLAFARRQPLELQTVPVNDVVRGTLGLVGPLLGEAVTVDTHLDEAAGAVRVDRSRFEQVLVNLLVNARDAMPAGGRINIATGNAHVTAADAHRHPGATAGEHVVVTIADTGHGMDAETMSHLFEPFFTTKHPGKGTGLGLATSYGTVRQSGGHIRVDSRPGAGATFRVYLPRVTEVAVHVASDVPTPTAVARETVLVAEDQAMLRMLVSRILRRQGYTVIEASDGAEALDVIMGQGTTVDLIVTDIVMPNLRGTELARRVRAVHPSIKVLFISGYPDDEPMEHLPPGQGFLPKPFAPQVLGERVRALLDG